MEIAISAESVASSNLCYSEIEKTKLIGEGGYIHYYYFSFFFINNIITHRNGVVYLGNYRGSTVAIKEMKSWGITDHKVISEIKREVDLMRRLRSPYIINFYGAAMSKRNMCIVMEFCKYGTLSNLIHEKAALLSTELKLKVALDGAMGMSFLHSQNIIHRDLKPDNLLVVSLSPKSNVTVKLTDFGSR